MSTTATVLMNFLLPEFEPRASKSIENVGTGIDATGKCSVAPACAIIGSSVTIGDAPPSLGSAIRASAGAAAAPCPPVLAAIGSACPCALGAHRCSATAGGLPSIGFGMDSSSAASLGSGAGIGS